MKKVIKYTEISVVVSMIIATGIILLALIGVHIFGSERDLLMVSTWVRYSVLAILFTLLIEQAILTIRGK